MRLTDRILSTCSVVALAAMCIVTLGTSDAHSAQKQTQAKQAQVTRHTAARPPAPRPVASRTAIARPVVATRPSQHAARPSKLRAGVNIPRSKSGNIKSAKTRVASLQSWGGISCVPFVRAATGMEVKGNAHAWWNSAAGTYERGHRPEAGSVLNFRSTSRMRLGHVAVVARVIDSRTVEIDHANWAGPRGGKGQVARGVPVIDVSSGNDWSAVQVGLPGGGFGSVYPTYGFIYDRPDHGVMVANTLAKPGTPRYAEVAEAWSTRVVPTTGPSRFIDAPQRSLR